MLGSSGALREQPMGQAFMPDDAFLPFEYLHTNVVHKKKVGEPQHYTQSYNVKLPSGFWKSVWGGTQGADGFWASLRRSVGRRAVNTGKAGSEKRKRLQHLVLTLQCG